MRFTKSQRDGKTFLVSGKGEGGDLSGFLSCFRFFLLLYVVGELMGIAFGKSNKGLGGLERELQFGKRTGNGKSQDN
jgi:hypothetical protein